MGASLNLNANREGGGARERMRGGEKDGIDPELAMLLRTHPQVVRSVGLYKVMGEAVQAVVGGVYHQFGASVTHRLFHTRILPHLLLRGPLGLPEAYHADAYNKGKRLGKRGLVGAGADREGCGGWDLVVTGNELPN